MGVYDGEGGGCCGGCGSYHQKCVSSCSVDDMIGNVVTNALDDDGGGSFGQLHLGREERGHPFTHSRHLHLF